MSKPLVSICMPVWNGQRFLPQTLDSLLAQDYGNFEIIILDNISTDDTPNICCSYAEKDSRIRYIVDDVQVGVHEGHNRVAHYAKGEYFIPMCDDDIYEPTYISKLMSIMNSNEGIGLVFCDFGYVDINGKIWTKGGRRKWMDFFKSSSSKFLDFLLYMFLRSSVPMVFGLFRTSVHKKALPFVHVDQTVWNVDNMFMLRILSRAKVACIKEVLFYYRQRDRSNTMPDDWPNKELQRYWYRVKHQVKVTLTIVDIINKSTFSKFQKVILKIFAPLSFFYFFANITHRLIKHLLHEG